MTWIVLVTVWGDFSHFLIGIAPRLGAHAAPTLTAPALAAAPACSEGRAPTALLNDDELSSTANASAPVKRPGIESSPSGA